MTSNAWVVQSLTEAVSPFMTWRGNARREMIPGAWGCPCGPGLKGTGLFMHVIVPCLIDHDPKINKK